MAELYRGLQVEESKFFNELNFHPSLLLDDLRKWLNDNAFVPLGIILRHRGIALRPLGIILRTL
ncbi:MAG: hypothetical protein SD837_13975 [Candidatus Electrothrix scaldis]|nr:MAG: hypothetical protein SD837_13975 [Candidatus Electrothrix sp. GW3-3]